MESIMEMQVVDCLDYLSANENFNYRLVSSLVKAFRKKKIANWKRTKFGKKMNKLPQRIKIIKNHKN